MCLNIKQYIMYGVHTYITCICSYEYLSTKRFERFFLFLAFESHEIIYVCVLYDTMLSYPAINKVLYDKNKFNFVKCMK